MSSPFPQTVLRVALPVPLRQLFDYLPLENGPDLVPGMRVCVSFGHRKMVAVVTDIVTESELPIEKLSPVLAYPDDDHAVLNDETLGLLNWCWHYYKHSPGEVVFNALPPLLRKSDGVIPQAPVQYHLTDTGKERLQQPPGRIKAQIRLLEFLQQGPATEAQLRTTSASWKKTVRSVQENDWLELRPQQAALLDPSSGPELNDEQKVAVKNIAAGIDEFGCHLLDGVTGSGKTEVYLHLLEQVLRRGGQGLLLVPEIGLTPQLLSRFEKRLGFKPVVTHSGLSERERLNAWAMARSGLARLVIGTRSALFLPMPDLQLIILDEEHDASFKQQDGFRYSSRDVAVKRASSLGVLAIAIVAPTVASVM